MRLNPAERTFTAGRLSKKQSGCWLSGRDNQRPILAKTVGGWLGGRVDWTHPRRRGLTADFRGYGRAGGWVAESIEPGRTNVDWRPLVADMAGGGRLGGRVDCAQSTVRRLESDSRKNGREVVGWPSRRKPTDRTSTDGRFPRKWCGGWSGGRRSNVNRRPIFAEMSRWRPDGRVD